MQTNIPPGWKDPITVDYVNWRGERATRTIRPIKVFWGSNEWHRDPQWLLLAYDPEKDDQRTFALKDCNFQNQPEGLGPEFPEPTLSSHHIERCARAVEAGFSTVDARRAAAIMRELAADRDKWLNNARVLLANIDHIAEILGEGPEEEDGVMVEAIRAEIEQSK